MKVIISEKISKEIKMNDDAETSGNAKILQPLVNTIKTTEPQPFFSVGIGPEKIHYLPRLSIVSVRSSKFC